MNNGIFLAKSVTKKLDHNKSLICPLDDIVNEKIFRSWTNDIGVRILQYSELSAVYRRWNQNKKLSDDLYIALTHNKDEMLDSLRLFIELGIDSSSLKTDGLSMEHRLFAYMLKMTENESLFKLPQLPNLPEIISLFKKQAEDEKAEKEPMRRAVHRSAKENPTNRGNRYSHSPV